MSSRGVLFSVFVVSLALPASAEVIRLSSPKPVAPGAISSYDWPAVIHSIVADGDQFVAFWLKGPFHEQRPRPAELMATRVAEDGRALDTTSVLLLPDVSTIRAQPRPGGGYLVQWSNYEAAQTLVVSRELAVTDRVGTNGRYLACGTSRCATLGGSSAGPPWTLELSIVDAGGRDVATMQSSSEGAAFDLSASGPTFLVHSIDYRNNVELRNRFLLLSDDGESIATLERRGQMCAMTPDETGYAIACAASPNTAEVSRIDRAGRVIMTAEVDLPAKPGWHPTRLVLASSRAGFLLVTELTQSIGMITTALPPSQVYASRLGQNLFSFDPSPLEIAATSWRNDTVTAASNGHSFLVGWAHHRGSSWYPAARVAAVPAMGSDGGRGSLTALREGAADQFPQAIAASPSAHLAVWSENAEEGMLLKARRTTTDGNPLDASPLVLGHLVIANHLPTAASNGSTFAVAWQSVFDYSLNSYAISTALVDAGDGRIVIGPRILGFLASAIVSDGRSFYFAYYTLSERQSFLVRMGPYGAIESRMPLHGYAFRALAITRDRLLIILTRLEGTFATVYTTEGTRVGESMLYGPSESGDVQVTATDDMFYVFATTLSHRDVQHAARVTLHGTRLDGGPAAPGKPFPAGGPVWRPGGGAAPVGDSIVLIRNSEAMVFDRDLSDARRYTLATDARRILVAAEADGQGLAVLGDGPFEQHIRQVVQQRLTLEPGLPWRSRLIRP